MSRTLAINKHKKRKEIAEAIADGMPTREIAQKYGVSRLAVQNFKRSITGIVTNRQAELKHNDREAILNRLELWLARVQKVVDACDEYLTDPEHPEKYNLAPRDTDITVIYEAEEDHESPGDPDDEDSHVKITRRKVRKTAKLSELLCTVPNIFQVRWKIADPRELILKAVIAGKAQLELIAQIIGVIKKTEAANVQINFQTVVNAMPIVVEVLRRFPDAEKAVRDRLMLEYKGGKEE
jgi:DNA-binding CsgD family transcriptional regulator